MNVEPNAVELTVDHAWFIAETIGAGNFPWVLAITTPYCDAAQRGAFMQCQKDELIQMGVVSADGAVNRAVADWIRVAMIAQCRPPLLEPANKAFFRPRATGRMARSTVLVCVP